MRKITVIMGIFLFFSAALYAEDQEYTNYSIVRLNYITGSTYIQRAADLSYEEGELNTPISKGDRLGTTDGRAEILLGRGNYIRLDYNTKIDFLSLPEKENDLTQIRIWSGNIYLSVNNLEREKSIEIHTSDISFYILDAGLYRVDVREDTETELFVFNGLVEAAGESGSVLTKDEQRVEAIEGRFTSRPTRFMAVAEDSFDRWSEDRDSEVGKYLAQEYMPEELEDFEYELGHYGNWVYLPPYGQVWVPGSIDAGWRPYYHGRWVWLTVSGWTWLPYEPWGWVTSHYGRWHWRIGMGWYWIPTSYWGPGWVSWYWGHDYMGWAPLSYYGYPGVVINNVYYGRYSKPYYPYSSRALTVIHKNQLKAKNVSKVALSQGSVQKLGNINLSNKSPAIRPEKNKVSVQKLDGKKVFLHKSEQNQKYSPANLSKSSSRRSGSGSVGAEKIQKNPAQKPAVSKSAPTIKRKTGFPSSPEISVKNLLKKSKPEKSRSILGRIYDQISGRSKTSIKSQKSGSSSKGTTSKRISSGSKSRSTSSKSSSRSGTSSKTTKTKKKK